MISYHHPKAQAGMDKFIAMFLIMLCFAFIVVFSVLMTNKTLESHTAADEISTVDTHLYVFLNTNYFTPNTKLPMKDVISAALSKNSNPSADDPIKIEYNNAVDTIIISDCIREFTELYYTGEYSFSVDYGGKTVMVTGSSSDADSSSVDSDSEDSEDTYMTEEVEYIVVPKDDVASVHLRIEKNDEVEDEVIETTDCLAENNMYCIRRTTCQIYGGICKIQYGCGINQCCCKDMPF